MKSVAIDWAEANLRRHYCAQIGATRSMIVSSGWRWISVVHLVHLSENWNWQFVAVQDAQDQQKNARGHLEATVTKMGMKRLEQESRPQKQLSNGSDYWLDRWDWVWVVVVVQ
jgi:hypothetical protein